MTPSQGTVFELIFKKPYDRVHLSTFTQFGKLVSDDTPVMTTQGWKKHGELRVGDFVFSPLGQPVRVIEIHPKGFADRVVVFSQGEEIECSKEHEWEVWNVNDKTQEPKILETQEIQQVMARMKAQPHSLFSVQNIQPLVYPEKELPFDPYTLGVWLGDGTSVKPTITTPDTEIINAIPYTVSAVHIHNQTKVPSFDFYKEDGFYTLLQEMNLLGNKHIPDDYLFSSIEQRKELLAGLLDTDGTVHYGMRNGWPDSRVTFSNTNSAIVDGVMVLIESLGLRPSKSKILPRLSSSGIQGRKPVYQIGFSPTFVIPTRVSRKKIIPIKKQRRRTIKEIREIEPKQGNCITVEGGLYLVGKKLIPTHNSLTVALATLTRCVTYPEKWAIIAPSQNKARIIMGYIIDHVFDNPLTEQSLEIDRSESSIRRLQTERSKNRLTFQLGSKDGKLLKSEIFIVSADSRNKLSSGDSLMGLGCLGGDEIVETEFGKQTIKQIVEEKKAKFCLSYNHTTNRPEFQTILSYQENPIKDRYLMEIDFGGEKIVCTNDHPVFVKDRGYVRADELEVGDNGIRIDK